MKDEAPAMIESLKKVIMRMHYPLEVMLTCVRWYVVYPLSLRHIEEMMAARGVRVDHATVHRWAIKISPVLAAVFRRRKRPVGTSWRMDETYIRVAGQWRYQYRAVDRDGNTIDFLLRANRDHAAARIFIERAIGLHGVPEKITIDKSGSNTAAILSIKDDSGSDIELRQNKYMNNIVEQGHRAIKRIVRPMLGFKSFRSARALISGIETMHMIKKGQLDGPHGRGTSAASQFVYFTELYGHKVRRIEPNGVVTTLAGTGAVGSANGASSTATFNEPVAVLLDAQGNLVVVDHLGSLIRKIGH